MSRIQTTFAALKQQNKKALIPYITAGDPHPKHTVGLMHALVKSGADIIELGVPFSDPMADGPVIQRASERALVHKVSLGNVLEMVQEFRQQDTATPIVLMGYANPVEAMGMETFVQRAKAAGVDGVLTVDYPPEECMEFVALLQAQLAAQPDATLEEHTAAWNASRSKPRPGCSRCSLTRTSTWSS